LGYKNTFILVTLFLSIAIGLYGVINSHNQISTESQVERITSRLAVYLQEVNAELDKQVASIKASGELATSDILFVLLKGDSLHRWTDNHFIPPVKALTADFTTSVIKISSGDVLAVKKAVSKDVFVVALIPLHIQYKITNNYLPVYWNDNVFDRPAKSILEPGSVEGYSIVTGGQLLFKVVLSTDQNLAGGTWNYLIVISFVVAIGCAYLLFINWFLDFSITAPGLGFIALAGLLVAVRIGMLASDFPSQFLDWNLFDPQSFASSEFNPSLGDFFLNTVVVFLLCMYLLFRFKYFKILNFIPDSKFLGWLLSVFYVLSILFGFLYFFVVIQTIYNNSTLSFSLFHSLSFDSLRIVAILAIVLSGVSIFMFIHIFIRLLIADSKWIRIYFSVSIGVALFILINVWTQQVFLSSLFICLIYLGLVLGFRLHSSLSKLQFISFAYLFTCVIFLSISGVFAIEYFEERRAVKNQFSFAENFLSERDYFGEYLLQESATKIVQDAFIQTRIASPFLSRDPVKQKITQVLLSGYFSRYSVKVLLFNASGEPLGNEDKTTFYEWSKAYDNETFRTDYKNVFYIANETTDFAPKYLTFIPISKNNSPLGFIVLELSLKRVIPESVYPELLVDNRFQRSNNPNLSYALITGNEAKYSTGDFNYQGAFKDIMRDSSLFFYGFSYRDYLHVGVKDQLGRVVIVSEPVKSKMSWIVNFSFLLLVGLLIISFVLLGYWVFVVSKTEQLNLATRIQLILNLAFFIPLVSVSVVTLGLTTRSVQMQLEEEYLSKAKQIAPALAEAKLNSNQLEGPDFDATFTSIINQLNVDANMFSLEGNLITSSQLLIFENQLLSPYINPVALENIRSGEKLFIRNERVGDLKFSVAYATLLSPVTGEQLGIIAVPFFQSLESLEKLQVTVLGNILSIFTLIFIILVFVSFLVTKWLTSPLQFITNTLGKISLTRENKPLQWSANDEVGMMVNQYNIMLEKLEESKRELERTQREQAWREIAQQVAHEIKNPLTPMKLTLQQLERSLENGSEDTERLKSSIASLLTHLNALNDIASSFSSFAKMPTPVITEVNLLQVLQKTIASFKEECSITLESEVIEAILLADEKILNRVFVNLLLNSIQAARPDIPLEVQIRLELLQDHYRIIFSDNGKGIEDALKDKIFLPHFTTKKSGSGLGLAIAKESINQMGGTIYFETSVEGTRFFIELKRT
jgi:two-component system nitrogen regulation sensor histidine kinase NtrY